MSVTNFDDANIAIFKMVSAGAAYDITLPFESDSIEWWNFTEFGTNSKNISGVWIKGMPALDALIIARGASVSGSQAVLSNKTQQSVALNSAITFDTNTVLGAGYTHTVGAAGLTVLGAGTYQFEFNVSGTEPNQFQVLVNGAAVPGTTFASGAGTQQNIGFGFLTLAANDVVTLENKVSAAAVTLESNTPIGGTNVDNSNATLSLSLVGAGASALTSVLESTNGITVLPDGSGFKDEHIIPTAIVAATSVVTKAAHGLVNGQFVRGTNFRAFPVADATGMYALNNQVFQVGNVTTNTFELLIPYSTVPVDLTTQVAFVNNGIARFTLIGQKLFTQNPAPIFKYTLGTAIMGVASDVIYVRAMKANQYTDLGVLP